MTHLFRQTAGNLISFLHFVKSHFLLFFPYRKKSFLGKANFLSSCLEFLMLPSSKAVRYMTRIVCAKRLGAKLPPGGGTVCKVIFRLAIFMIFSIQSPKKFNFKTLLDLGSGFKCYLYECATTENVWEQDYHQIDFSAGFWNCLLQNPVGVFAKKSQNRHKIRKLKRHSSDFLRTTKRVYVMIWTAFCAMKPIFHALLICKNAKL